MKTFVIVSVVAVTSAKEELIDFVSIKMVSIKQ